MVLLCVRELVYMEQTGVCDEPSWWFLSWHNCSVTMLTARQKGHPVCAWLVSVRFTWRSSPSLQ